MLVVNIILLTALNIASSWRLIICENVIKSLKLHFLTMLILVLSINASIQVLWGKISLIVILDVWLVEINIQFTRLVLIYALVIAWFASSLMSRSFVNSTIKVVGWRRWHTDLLNVHQDGSCDIFGHSIQILPYLDLAWVPKMHGFEIVSSFGDGTAVYKSGRVVLEIILLLAFMLQSITHINFICLLALYNSVGGSSIMKVSRHNLTSILLVISVNSTHSLLEALLNVKVIILDLIVQSLVQISATVYVELVFWALVKIILESRIKRRIDFRLSMELRLMKLYISPSLWNSRDLVVRNLLSWSFFDRAFNWWHFGHIVFDAWVNSSLWLSNKSCWLLRPLSMRTLYTTISFLEVIWINLIDIGSDRIRIRINLLFLEVIGDSTSFENARISFSLSQRTLCRRHILIISK